MILDINNENELLDRATKNFNIGIINENAVTLKSLTDSIIKNYKSSKNINFFSELASVNNISIKIVSLINKKCNIIIGTNQIYYKSFTDAATKNPGIKFITVNETTPTNTSATNTTATNTTATATTATNTATNSSTLKNLISFNFVIEQSAFLAGYLAAKTTLTNNVGMIIESTFNASDEYVKGFYQGIYYYNKNSNKSIQLTTEYVTDNNTILNCANIMQEQKVDVLLPLTTVINETVLKTVISNKMKIIYAGPYLNIVNKQIQDGKLNIGSIIQVYDKFIIEMINGLLKNINKTLYSGTLANSFIKFNMTSNVSSNNKSEIEALVKLINTNQIKINNIELNLLTTFNNQQEKELWNNFGNRHKININIDSNSNRDNIINKVKSGAGDIIYSPHEWRYTFKTNDIIIPIEIPNKNEFETKLLGPGPTYFGIPFNKENIGLFVNTKLVPKPPTTFEELEQICVKNGWTILIAGPDDPYHMYPILKGLGAIGFGSNNNNLSYNTSTMTASDIDFGNSTFLSNVDKLDNWYKTLFTFGVDGWTKMMELWNDPNTKTPFLISGPWQFQNIKNVPYTTAPIPSINGIKSVPCLGLRLVYLTKQMSLNPYKNKIIKLVASSSEQILMNGSPVNIKSIENYGNIYIKHLGEAGIDGDLIPYGPFMDSVWVQLANAIKDIKSGKQKAKDAFTIASANIKGLKSIEINKSSRILYAHLIKNKKTSL